MRIAAGSASRKTQMEPGNDAGGEVDARRAHEQREHEAPDAQRWADVAPADSRAVLLRCGNGSRHRAKSDAGREDVQPQVATISPVSTIERLSTSSSAPMRRRRSGMSDPAVYNDRNLVAVAGRRLKELEAPHRLAEEWKSARADLEDARGDAELAGMAAELEQDIARLEEELRLAPWRRTRRTRRT